MTRRTFHPATIPDRDKAADEMLKRLMPGRARVALFAYDDAPPSKLPGYRAVPGKAFIVNVRTKAEANSLWRAVLKVIKSEEWTDERRTRVRPKRGVPSAPVADLGASS